MAPSGRFFSRSLKIAWAGPAGRQDENSCLSFRSFFFFFFFFSTEGRKFRLSLNLDLVQKCPRSGHFWKNDPQKWVIFGVILGRLRRPSAPLKGADKWSSGADFAISRSLKGRDSSSRNLTPDWQRVFGTRPKTALSQGRSASFLGPFLPCQKPKPAWGNGFTKIAVTKNGKKITQRCQVGGTKVPPCKICDFAQFW